MYMASKFVLCMIGLNVYVFGDTVYSCIDSVCNNNMILVDLVTIITSYKKIIAHFDQKPIVLCRLHALYNTD